MRIDRRSFLLALAGSFVAPGFVAAAGDRLYVSSCTDAGGINRVAVFSTEGGVLFSTALPERGHDITLSPASNDLVVFARRPGDWAAVVDRTSGAVRHIIRSPKGRHFYGHGVYSRDGRLLYATENDVANGRGVLGVYDSGAEYKRIGEQPTHGVGPHDLAFIPGSELMLVANGGIRTDPDSGREILNAGKMEPSLALIDPRSGEVRHKTDFGTALSGLSIRHLAMAPDGEAAFACQFEGDDLPALVGLISADGRARMLEMPDEDLARLDNYVGSVALDGGGRLIAATSPRGGMAAFWDRESEKYLGLALLPDVCGVAAAPESGVFLVTSGNAGMRLAKAESHDLARVGGSDLDLYMWDNHTEIIRG